MTEYFSLSGVPFSISYFNGRIILSMPNYTIDVDEMVYYNKEPVGVYGRKMGTVEAVKVGKEYLEEYNKVIADMIHGRIEK